jgi:hypothetical protein
MTRSFEMINMIELPVMALSDAIKSKMHRALRVVADLTRPATAVMRLGLITIQVPTASPFTDELSALRNRSPCIFRPMSLIRPVHG